MDMENIYPNQSLAGAEIISYFYSGVDQVIPAFVTHRRPNLVLQTHFDRITPILQVRYHAGSPFCRNNSGLIPEYGAFYTATPRHPDHQSRKHPFLN
jgi:hypothetical protein